MVDSGSLTGNYEIERRLHPFIKLNFNHLTLIFDVFFFIEILVLIKDFDRNIVIGSIEIFKYSHL